MAKKTITISQDIFDEHIALPCPDVEKFDLGTPKMQAVMEPAIQAMEKVVQAVKKGTARDAQAVINFLSLWHNYVRYASDIEAIEQLDAWKLKALPKVAAWWAEKHESLSAPKPAKKAASKKTPRSATKAKKKR